MVDTRGGATPAARRRLLDLARVRAYAAPTTSARPGTSRPTEGCASPRTSTPAWSGSGSSCPGPSDGVVYAGTEPGAVWRSRDGGETFELERGALGPPAPGAVGRRLRRPGLPHDPAAPDRPRLGDGGDLDRRRLPDHGRRCDPGSRATTGSGRSSCPRASSTPSSASACTRSPGTPRAPSGCSCRTTAASTAPTTRAAPGRPSPTGCPPTSASRSWCTRTSPTRSTSSRSTAATGATRPRPRPGCGARATPASTWEELGDGLPDAFYVAVMRDAMCVDDHASPGPLLRRPQRRGLGQRRRGRDLAEVVGRPARRDVRPGGRDLPPDPYAGKAGRRGVPCAP